MTPTLVVARKELRALFQSPVALIFLGVHQLVVLLAFFGASRFFARNLADVRPLFDWLPLLLVFLTAAITMRAWAEERKLGTLEVLMTLPVRTRDLVLGKFLAATALVGIALALTLPLPLMVAQLGPLDWGPVIGGYVGALLLGASYAALGLCVSSRTDNQVVSLMVTLVVGGLLYVVGTEPVTALVSTDTGEILRALGTGARFESIGRGVLDVRDLAYYAAWTATFLALNHAFLEGDRIDPDSARGAARQRGIALVTALIAANAVAAVVWLTPVTAARVDLTENGEYTISPATRSVLGALDEPLFIHGYFSERTHPALAPLVPQLRDLLTEYAIAGGDTVQVDFADPNADPDLEGRLADQFSIRAVPVQVDDRTQVAVVNSFFHILVRYGDQHAVLSFDDLIEVNVATGQLDVRLRNPEYDLTRTIKRVSQDFKPLRAVLADLPAPATITLYASPGSLPDAYREVADTVRTVGARIASDAGDAVTFTEVDPAADRGEQERIYEAYGVRPLAADLLATQVFWFDIVLTMGDEIERIALRGEVSESDVSSAMEAALRRLVPGQRTTVGLLTEEPEAPPPNPQIPPQFQPPPPQADYRGLEQLLGREVEIRRLTLDGEEPTIDPTLDVLLIARPGTLSATQRFAIDQYLMRGGRVVALAGSHDISVDGGQIAAKPAATGLGELLAAWGVTVDGSFVLDEQNAPFPRPVRERRGGIMLQRVELAPYPFFVDVRTNAMAQGHAAMSGLDAITVPWAAPLTVSAPDGVEATVLAHTTAGAWTSASSSIEPAPPTGDRGEQVLAVALTGAFPSAFKDKPDPTRPGGGDTRTVIDRSLPDARLAVVGSSAVVGDLVLSLAQQPGGEVHASNLQWIGNLIDWSVEDTELLTIRTSGAYARTLLPIDDATRQAWEAGQVVLAIVLVLGIAAGARRRRDRIVPVPLPTTRSEVA